ncbi:MAG TPA: uroporphyrinogen-III synthase [Chlamydiales bacterium]
MHPSSEKPQIIGPCCAREDRAGGCRFSGPGHPASLSVGARSSPLSRAQFEEVLAELRPYWPRVSFSPMWIETQGDKDKTISLRNLGKTDFFTRELDELLLNRAARLAIHSAKDLPHPLPHGLSVAAFTQGLDARDALVFQDALRPNCLVATSSERREEAVRALYPSARFVDVRGPIGERLALLEQGKVDGVVIAEAALIRLKMTTLKRLYLPGTTVEGQGQLAILCRTDDEEMHLLCRCIDARRTKQILYLGLDPARFSCKGDLHHHPVIQTVPIKTLPQAVYTTHFSHIVFTSPAAVKHWLSLSPPSLSSAHVLALGSGTAATLREHGFLSLVAPEPTQEGMIALLKTLTPQNLLWPKSAHARPLLAEYLKENHIPHLALDLYHTVTNKALPAPDVSSLDEIVFTSPSTVKAFLDLYGSFPHGVKLTPIGPVTKKHISTNSFFHL